MSLNKKLNIAMTFISVILLSLIIITWNNLDRIDKNVDEVFNEKIESVQIVNKIIISMGMQGLYARTLFIENTAENQNALLQSANELNDDINKLSKFNLSLEEERQLEILKEGNDEFNKAYPSMLEALNKKNIEGAKQLLINNIKPSNVKILKSSNIILEIQNKQLEKMNKETKNSVSDSNNILFFLIAAIALSLGFILFFIQKGIIRPLRLVSKLTNEISKGNLNAKDIEVKSKDEIGLLTDSFNNMKNVLHNLINKIQTNAHQLRSSSNKLTISTEEMAAVAEEITIQTETSADISTASSQSLNDSMIAMDETARGVQNIAEASQQLQSLSDETKKIATNGDSVINIARDQMSTISVSTEQVQTLVNKLSQQIKEIESISKIISNVTDQTNLLALNAAIEAARAGEYGKGFAVVADEVKKLSNESKKSTELINQLTIEIQKDTKEVQTAVENTLNSVKDGVKVINNAGDSFGSIVKDVNKMYIQISDVSATAEQLSAGAEEVSASITEIATSSTNTSEGLTTIAAAMEEQTATMSNINSVTIQLNENILSLQQEVDKFKI